MFWQLVVVFLLGQSRLGTSSALDCFVKADVNGWYPGCSYRSRTGSSADYQECAQDCIDYGDQCGGFERNTNMWCYIFTKPLDELDDCGFSACNECHKWDRISPDCDPDATTTTAPTAAPSAAPTTSPSAAPTTCDPSEISTVDWDDLHHVAGNGDHIVHNSSITFDAASLSLSVSAALEYIGKSMSDGNNLGTTFWIDFGSILKSGSAIDSPGSCGNRQSDDYSGVAVSEYYTFVTDPSEIEGTATSDRMAYPPSGWTLTSSGCHEVQYRRNFSWTQLTECTDGDGNDLIKVTQTDDEITLSGTLIVELVSPYSTSSVGLYRSFSVIQRDFSISLTRTINLLSSTGAELFVTSILAFGQGDGGYEMRLMVESRDFIEMNDTVTVISSPMTVGSIQAVTTDCIVTSSTTCAEIYAVTIPADCSPSSASIDLSGDYQFGFTPRCRTLDDGSTDQSCDAFVNSLGNTGMIVLDATSVFVDDCTADLFSVTFDGDLAFYEDDGFVNMVDDDSDPFQVGDTIYGQISVQIPDDVSGESYQFVDVSVETVFVCTSSDPVAVTSSLDAIGSGGCVSSLVDPDGPHHVIGNGAVSEYEGTIYDVDANNVARFSFCQCFDFETPRTNLAVHVQVLLTLQTDTGVRRRRMLLRNGNSNQIRHFIGTTNIEPPADEGFNVQVVIGSAIGGTAVLGSVVLVAMLMKRGKAKSAEKVVKNVHVPDQSSMTAAATSTPEITEKRTQTS